MITINSYSLASFYCECFFRDTRLSNATCFLTKRKSELYLVTNWHVVTGRHPDTGKCLSKTCAIPNELHVFFPKKQEMSYSFDDYFCVPLVDKNGNNLWKEIQIGQRFLDVVVIPIRPDPCFYSFCIEEAEEPYNEGVDIEITSPLYILGFPFGRDFGYLPIWKKGTIASEPQYEFDNGYPYFFVDTASRQGMSGSPVVLFDKRAVTIINEEKNKISTHFTKFIGIYSGRVGVNEEGDAQLGRVWKAEVIDRLIDNDYS